MPAHVDTEVDPDAILVRRIAGGDEDAFSTLYSHYLPLVLRWCLRETRNRELAADLAAEVFAASLISARRYRPGQASVASWLLGIARNKLRESRRRHRIEDSARRRLGVQPAQLTDAALERVEELVSLEDGLLELLGTLPADQREAITQRVIEERSYAEIADELSCSESVIRQRVSRGLRTLRSELEGE